MKKQIFQLRSRRAGFTLIELLVVIAIIGLLSTLAVVALNNARLKSRDSKRVSDIKQIQVALELYFNDQNNYPIKNSSAVILGAAGQTTLSEINGFSDTPAGVVYMSQVPSMPTPLDGATAGYSYKSNVAGSIYSIEYYLGAATGEAFAGLNTACAAGIQGCALQ